VCFYPDTSSTGLKRLAPALSSALDVRIFAGYAPVLSRALRRRGIGRLFILLGADPWFLPKVSFLQKRGFQTDLYLVDDIEASAMHAHNRVVANKSRQWLSQVFKASSQVWAISEAFTNYLAHRFGVDARWLPIPSAEPPPDKQALGPGPDACASIVFSGGLNHLYLEPLRILYDEIDAFNKRNVGGKPLRLEVLTYGGAAKLLGMLPHTKWVVVSENLPLYDRLQRMKRALALYLPYSFEEAEKQMVSTSFSCKLLEYLTVGRPILVYGPPYATIPRYFRKEGLPFCATHVDELRAHLRTLSTGGGTNFLECYREAWSKYHSPKAICEKLLRRQQ
jgi:hypothetical protein